MRARTNQLIRYAAVAAASGTALLYLLIGLGVLFVGDPAGGGDRDLLSFGLMTGAVFVLVAVVLALVARRLVWIPVALLTFVVIVAYFTMAEVRDPPFAFWGLAVKAVQLVLLGTVAFLAVRGWDGPARVGTTARPAP